MSAIFVPTISIATPRGLATVTIEVAMTPAEIERGLMYRDHLPYDAGMLFVMGSAAVGRAFWMLNTFIPLDIIFIGPDWTVTGVIPNAEPHTGTLRSINQPSAYVLEVNGGWAAAHQIAASAKVHPGYAMQEIC